MIQRTHKSSFRFLEPQCWLASGLMAVAMVSLAGCSGLPERIADSSQPMTHTTASAPVTKEQAASNVAQVGWICGGQQNDGSGCPSCSGSSSPAVCQSEPRCATSLSGPFLPPPWRVDPQEFLCDGGDQPPEAFLSQSDEIRNLGPEDTVSKYVTEAGDVAFAASNRVCVYAPRFGSVRQITQAVAGEKAVAAIGFDRREGPVGINVDLPGLVVSETVSPIKQQRTQRIDSMRERNRGVLIDRVQQPVAQVDFLAALAGIQNVGLNQLHESQLALVRQHAQAAIAWSIDESVEIAIEDLKAPVLTRDQKVDALVVYDFPDAGRLNLIKLVDRRDAKPGDTVTFLLRLQNVGDSPVTNVEVADNLTTRLEYVAESSVVTDPTSGESVDARLQVVANAVGSSKLIWTLPKTLAVGDMVEIKFECLIR
ncbi:MAG: DUF11 domain-containing protein [Planctomycetota bacterium]